jgi:hypothetical protein
MEGGGLWEFQLGSQWSRLLLGHVVDYLTCIDMSLMHQFPVIIDGAVLKVLENLIAFVDEVNDRPVGNLKRRFDEYSSKFSLSYETKVINPVEKSQTTEGDAC